MTTVVAIETDDGVEWAWDSQTTQGHRAGVNTREKVFRNGKLVFGHAGRVRDGQVIEQAKLPQPKGIVRVEHWVVTELVPAIQHALEKAGRLETVNTQVEYDSEFLVAVRGEVYRIGPDFGATRSVSGYNAIGSGSAYALGAMFAWDDLEIALDAAIDYDVYSNYPVRIVKNKEVGR